MLIPLCVTGNRCPVIWRCAIGGFLHQLKHTMVFSNLRSYDLCCALRKSCSKKGSPKSCYEWADWERDTCSVIFVPVKNKTLSGYPRGVFSNLDGDD